MHDRIRPGEIDVFEDAGPRRLRRKRLEALDAALVDDDDLAILDVANETRADNVERAGLGGEDELAVEFAKDERADAERIARADQLLVGQGDQRIGAFELAQRLDEALDRCAAGGCGRRDEGSTSVSEVD